ncbi:MAG: hypothetical protein DME99_01220 [Verrucomicrobia bacterium]|nr:MAG: hypothetical protein DME99_01220 [Verrucomicrobiota bacterium]
MLPFGALFAALKRGNGSSNAPVLKPPANPAGIAPRATLCYAFGCRTSNSKSVRFDVPVFRIPL